MELVNLSWIDYTLFAIMLAGSTLIGIYFGFYGKQDTIVDYLLGGNKMKIIPTSMSLVAGLTSGVTMLGYPAEMYMHGTQYSLVTLSLVVVGVIVNYIYLPVLYKLQFISVYEYLEKRFDKKTRVIAAGLLSVTSFLFTAVIIYGPALAFNYVTGINIRLISITLSLICVFYTTFGGVKAVVWADTLQLLIILITLGFILIMGMISMNDISFIWQAAEQSNRLEFFNMNPDPTIRASFWSVVLGNLFFWTFYIGIFPCAMQRYQSVPTLNHAKKILGIAIFFSIFCKTISCFAGLIAYAKYYDCDPLSAGYISKPDQILPYYLVHEAAKIPGITGLFFAGLFSAALSTLSTNLNTLSGTIYMDFVQPFMPEETSERKASSIIKVFCALIGILSVAVVSLVEKLGTMTQMTLSISGITTGSVLGIFTLGILFPKANKHGALFGMVSSLVLMSVIVITNQMYVWNGTIKTTSKPLHTYGCNNTLIASTEASTLPLINDDMSEEPFWLFRISFNYYSLIGTLVAIIVGLPISWITNRGKEAPVDRDLLSPYVHRFLAKSVLTGSYDSVQNKE